MENQVGVLKAIAEEGASWSDTDLAFAIAVARTESGFNPDAASRTTSASGIGQLIDATGRALGITDRTRFSLRENIRATLHLLAGELKWARARSPEDPYPLAYARYHDGPALDAGGVEIARKQVIPTMEEVLRCASTEADHVPDSRGP